MVTGNGTHAGADVDAGEEEAVADNGPGSDDEKADEEAEEGTVLPQMRAWPPADEKAKER